MINTQRINRRQAAASSRIIARNLRAAVRHEGLNARELRSIERRHGIPAGALFLALAGIRLNVTHMYVLQHELGLSVTQVFAGTGSNEVSA